MAGTAELCVPCSNWKDADEADVLQRVEFKRVQEDATR